MLIFNFLMSLNNILYLSRFSTNLLSILFWLIYIILLSTDTLQVLVCLTVSELRVYECCHSCFNIKLIDMEVSCFYYKFILDIFMNDIVALHASVHPYLLNTLMGSNFILKVKLASYCCATNGHNCLCFRSKCQSSNNPPPPALNKCQTTKGGLNQAGPIHDVSQPCYSIPNTTKPNPT